MKRAVILLFVMAVLTVAWPAASIRTAEAQGVGLQAGFDTAPLELVTGMGRHAFTVEIAKTTAERGQGLMFRPTLAPDRGMLFLYPESQVISMWMKNTLIPLDMLFLDGTGKVVALHERAVPGSLQSISSGVRASAVLELAGGTVDRLGIRTGDRVVSPALPDR